jgi:hypothetical protein
LRAGRESNSTAVPVAMLRVPSAIAVQWKRNVDPSSAVMVPRPAVSSNSVTVPVI